MVMTSQETDRAAMFSRIAARYDRINALISLGLDRRWRRALVRRLPREWRPGRILDVCCGTGALLFLLGRAFPQAGLVGLDFSRGMLAVAELRLKRRGGPACALVQGDQNALPYPDESFPLVTNAFGLRNSLDPRRSLAESARVLAPGGLAGFLELTRPQANLTGRLFNAYFTRLAPLTARCFGGDRDAYQYLPASVRDFHTRSELAAELAQAFPGKITVVPLFGSVVTLYLAGKPQAAQARFK